MAIELTDSEKKSMGQSLPAPKLNTIPSVELRKSTQKEEWINTILIEITNNPKITNNELAEKYHITRNRISVYRNIIRQNLLRDTMETLNKVNHILEERLNNMDNRDLINLRRQLIPQQLNVQGDIRTETHISLEMEINKIIKFSREQNIIDIEPESNTNTSDE
jgi:hypothetical protein